MIVTKMCALVSVLMLLPLSVQVTLAQSSSIRMGSVNMPLELDQQGSGLALSNLSFYINKTDGHYHFKGIAKSVLPETLYNGTKSIVINFEDKATSTILKFATKSWDTLSTPLTIKPGETVPFDIDTGYTSSEANQFQFMKVVVSVG